MSIEGGFAELLRFFRLKPTKENCRGTFRYCHPLALISKLYRQKKESFAMKKPNLFLSAFAILSLASCGGGAYPVTTFTDAVGSIYNSSSPMQTGYLDEEMKFVNNDAGVPIDYELDEDSRYDMTKLNAFVSGLTDSRSN